MADTEQLVLSISADVRQMQRALDRMTKDTAVTTRKIEGHFDRMGKNVNKSLGAIGAFARGGLAGIAAGFSLQEAKQLLDANTRITNALKVAGLEGVKLEKVYSQLFETSQKFSTSFESMANLYSKLSLSQKDLGVSGDQLLQFINSIGAGLRVSGTSAEKASGAMLQLSQALGGGVVRAEEFSSMLDGMPAVMQAAADNIKQAGGSVSKLRDLINDGKISSKALFDAINAGAPAMAGKLATATTTIDGAFTKVGNALIVVAGEFNKTTGVSDKLANFLTGPLTDALGEIPKAFQPLIEILNFTSQAMDRLIQMSADFGEMTGLSQLGAKAGAQPYIGPGRAQWRINQAFGDQSYATPKTSRLTVGNVRTSVDNAVDITQPGYAVTGDKADKAAKSVADKLQKESDRAAEEFAELIGRQAEVAVDAATTLLDQSENTAGGRANINAFLKAGGVNLDAATTAWCAAFVNSALAQVGVTGTGSNLATSFLNFGKAVKPGDIQRGDIAVQPRGRGPGQTGGHVGFATGQTRFVEGIQQIEVLSGNLKDKVSKDWIDIREVIARRATEGTAIAADGFSHLTEKTVELTAAQQQLAETMANVADAAASSIGSFIQDLVDGKDASEALKNSLGQLADDLINIGLQGLTGSAGSGTGIAGLIASLIGGSLGATTLHRGGIAGIHGTPRTVPALAFAGAPRFHSGGMAGIRPGEVPAILQRGEVVLPKGARMGGSSVVVNNYSKAEVQAREQPGGKGFEIIIEERIADRINTRGTPANKAVQERGGQPAAETVNGRLADHTSLQPADRRTGRRHRRWPHSLGHRYRTRQDAPALDGDGRADQRHHDHDRGARLPRCAPSSPAPSLAVSRCLISTTRSPTPPSRCGSPRRCRYGRRCPASATGWCSSTWRKSRNGPHHFADPAQCDVCRADRHRRHLPA